MQKKTSRTFTSLANHFLVALPSLEDPNFSKAVVYIYEHNEEGALGLIINKPLSMQLNDVLKHLNINTQSEQVGSQIVMMGGPVGQEHGFVLYEESAEIYLSSSKETLVAIAEEKGPNQYLVTLGYSGWQAGQIEEELQRNDWLIVPSDNKILFNTPIDQRWETTAKIIGVDIVRMSNQTGHA
ncbi:MAG: YqgE/AlgH family protein [Proteobacteria bacterium]|nr:YqgE/AlgH family protein [Pseudomonadota bacterium]